MSADNSCGEPWDIFSPNGPQAIDADKTEILELKRQVSQLTVDRQARQLEELEEKYFRSQHPAVQDAWDKYQTVAKLARKK